MSRKVRLAEGVSWVKDSTQIIVVDVVQQKAHLLKGAEMAVWDWLMLGYPLGRIARMAAELQNLPIEAADKSLAGMIQGWCEAGLLEVTEQADG